MIDFTVAYDKIAHQTAEELREFFHSQGVVGKRGNNLQCPIANWIHATTGERYVVHGGIFNPGTEDHSIFAGIVTPEEPLTPGMGEFVSAFDRGEYPELVKE